MIFSTNKQSYKKFKVEGFIFCDKYKIYFESKAIKDSFDNLLKFNCQECLKPNKKVKSNKKQGSGVGSKDDGGRTDSPTTKCSLDAKKRQKAISPDQSGDAESRSARAQLVKVGDTSAAERLEEDGQGLLDSTELLCRATFPDIFGLRNHLNYKHKLRLCDLCLAHNKLFPFEYSYYNSEALDEHMKKGEPNTSHRGHPKCRLCYQTFFNNDELIRHMSREHFYCHFCGGQESNMRLYFLDYISLRAHFKDSHFLCERGNCRHEQFTSAFDSQIDYQMHMVQVHGNPSSNLSRGEARQQRTITLDSAPLRTRANSPNRSLRQNLPHNAALVSTGNMATANSSRQLRTPETIRQQIRSQQLPLSEFPALGVESVAASSRPTPQRVVQTSSSNQFPALSTAVPRPIPMSDTSLSQRLTAGPSNPRATFNRTLGGGIKPVEQLNEADFPPLPEQPKKKSNKSSQVKAARRNEELTLDQLISSSLTLSNNVNRLKDKKAGSKRSLAKKASKPLRIQL